MNSQNIILWRHADAEDIASEEELDVDRPLSDKGKDQAKKMASWLKQHLPKDTLILCSPALRAEQTVAALKRHYQIIQMLNPEASFGDALAVLKQTNAINVLLVGHQPWIGLLVAYLINPQIKHTNQLKMANVKKAGVWWFKRASPKHPAVTDALAYKLVAVQHPDFI